MNRRTFWCFLAVTFLVGKLTQHLTRSVWEAALIGIPFAIMSGLVIVALERRSDERKGRELFEREQQRYGLNTQWEDLAQWKQRLWIEEVAEAKPPHNDMDNNWPPTKRKPSRKRVDRDARL